MLNAIHVNRENLVQLFSKKFLTVILISVPSAIVADFFYIPLAWMIGPMIAASLMALSGFQVLMPRIALSSILIILGLHIGNYICLLYTSPSPRDRQKSRMPSSA